LIDGLKGRKPMAEYEYLPTKLTAENGAKALLNGEFKEEIRLVCPNCYDQEDPEEDCECCHGEGEYNQSVSVSWTTIKAIWDMAVEHFQANPIVSDAEKAAKVPRLSEKLPDSRGAWWHSRDLQTKASMGTVRACGVHGRLEWENDPLDEVGGYWAECLPPEMPEEPTFGRGLDKALKAGESARIAATDERINRRKS
jgi:hypothetical protein